MKQWLSLVVFLVISLGGGLLIGTTNQPGAWYEGLEKPWFNPPNAVFGPAWTLLYILIAVAGWLVWRRRDMRSLKVWGLQMALNFAWTPIFFGAQMLGVALVVVVAMVAAAIAFAVLARRTDGRASLLFMPYIAWLLYATSLNAALWQLNG
ncbi:TspO/MBR family protein [Aureimonas frigidaquae]|uniref:Tryptophan rich sensory protein n=1 Tax=Aureimonas frigidaquae TaxID=424757 RepID=A0A0P0Z3K1_9HYPH|nr:TspO/MBR family protein [Aureimonas frigidaquae]BAT28652.1 tryptophan rich sensory protein [Aureimonas frigidaquae]